MLENLAEAMAIVVRNTHLTLCGRCYFVDANGEFRDRYVGGYHYHKHRHEKCGLCGLKSDIPTGCCSNPNGGLMY